MEQWNIRDGSTYEKWTVCHSEDNGTVPSLFRPYSLGVSPRKMAICSVVPSFSGNKGKVQKTAE